MDETPRERQQQHVERHMPPRPPGGGDRAPREPGRPAAHRDGDKEKHAERALVGEEFGEREIHLLMRPAGKIGRLYLRTLQELEAASTQRNAAVDHYIAAVGEFQGMERVLLDEKHRELFFRVEF